MYAFDSAIHEEVISDSSSGSLSRFSPTAITIPINRIATACYTYDTARGLLLTLILACQAEPPRPLLALELYMGHSMTPSVRVKHCPDTLIRAFLGG